MLNLTIGELYEISFSETGNSQYLSDTMICTDRKISNFSSDIVEITVYVTNKNVVGKFYIYNKDLTEYTKLSCPCLNDSGYTIGRIILSET